MMDARVVENSKSNADGVLPSPSAEGDACSFTASSIDPFTHVLPWTLYDKLIILFNTFWLLPLRVCLLLIPTTIIGMVLYVIVGLGHMHHEPCVEPLKGWRIWLYQKCGKVLNRIFLFGFGFQWIKRKGQQLPPSEVPIMIISPHCSMFDMFLGALNHLPFLVARAENRHIPVLGRFFACPMHTIFVERSDSESRVKAMKEIQRRARDAGQWPTTLIFPEGTTTNRKSIIHFKMGAFSPQVPVQPVILHYNNRLNTMIWADEGIGPIMSLYLTLCQFHNSVEVEYLPPHYPTSQEKENTQLFADNVKHSMCRAGGFPSTDHQFDDVLLMRKAKQLGMPFTSGMVEYGRTAKQLQLSLEQFMQQLKHFALLDRDKDGFITIDDLAIYLEVPRNDCLQQVFKACHPDIDGKVSFYLYVSGMRQASRNLLNDAFISEIFQALDKDNDGIISSPVSAVCHCVNDSENFISMNEPIDYDTFRSALHISAWEYLVWWKESTRSQSI